MNQIQEAIKKIQKSEIRFSAICLFTVMLATILAVPKVVPVVIAYVLYIAVYLKYISDRKEYYNDLIEKCKSDENELV